MACCNSECNWEGEISECVHQPHSEQLLCPECHEVVEEIS